MTPNEIQTKTFEKKMGGYRIEEVTSYLAEVAACVQRLQEEKEEMERKMMVLAEKLEEYREDEDSLRSALIGAQKLGDSVVRDAKKKAELILAEASSKAEELVSDAKSNIDKEAIALSRMQGQVAEFKTQLLNLYQRHVDMISSIPEEPDLPKDMKEIVSSVAVEKQKEPVPEKKDKIENFVLNYEEIAGSADAEPAVFPVSEPPAHKHKRDFGNLRFGEEYNLTRND